MRKKILDRIALGIFIILLLGSLLINIKISKSSVIVAPEEDPLKWYRSSDLPIDCRVPEYENNLEIWKLNLRYNQVTCYCPKYYE